MKVVNFVTNPVNYKAVYVAILNVDQMMTPSCDSSEPPTLSPLHTFENRYLWRWQSIRWKILRRFLRKRILKAPIVTKTHRIWYTSLMRMWVTPVECFYTLIFKWYEILVAKSIISLLTRSLDSAYYPYSMLFYLIDFYFVPFGYFDLVLVFWAVGCRGKN